MTYEYVGKVVNLLKKKKIEKIIFGLLMCMPLIIFGGVFLSEIIRNWNGVNEINIETLRFIFISTSDLFIPVGEGALASLMQGFSYFFEILGISNDSAIPYLLVLFQVLYMVVIELVWLLYDFIIFIPRACRSLVERGM